VTVDIADGERDHCFTDVVHRAMSRSRRAATASGAYADVSDPAPTTSRPFDCCAGVIVT